MKHPTIVRLLTVGLLVPAPFYAFADDSAESTVEEVIVSATRRNESVMDISQSVQAMSRETLAMPAYKHIRNVYNLVPGATTGVTQGGKAPASEGIMLRGAGVTQTNTGGGSMPVGYYIDDVAFIDAQSLAPPPLGTFDLDRIEVLRGPQGTTYGQDSSSGSVIMRTAPVNLSETGYMVRTGMMSYGKGGDMGLTYGGVVNMPIVEDTLGIRISYISETDPGYGIVQGRPDLDNPLEEERVTMRTKVTWLPSENSEVTITHSDWQTDYGYLPGTSIKKSDQGVMEMGAMTSEYGLAVFPDGAFRNTIHSTWTTALAKIDLGWANLSYTYGDVDVKRRDTNSEDYNYGVVSFANTPSSTQSHEIRLVSQSEGPLSWIVGAMTTDSEGTGDNVYEAVGSYVNGAGEVISYSVVDSEQSSLTQETTSLYGELTYDINDSFTAVGGLRFHDEEFATFAQNVTKAADDPVIGPYTGFAYNVATEPYSHDNVSYRLGVEWKPSENGLVYLTRSTASRSPIRVTGANLAALTNAGLAGLVPQDAAELVSTEIGTKWTMNDGDLKVEFVYALGEWQDLALRSSVTGLTEALPIGNTDADIDSIEVSIEAALSDTLSFTYSGGFTDTKITALPDSTVATTIPAVLQVGGKLYNYSPATHSLSLNYNDELADGSLLYASTTYVTRSKIDAFSTLASVMDPCCYKTAPSGYKNMDVSVGLRRNSWDFNVSITNATDFDGMYGMVFSDLQNDGLIPYPRAIHLQVSYDNL